MSETQTDDGFDPARGTAAVKNPSGHASHRFTPPKPVRDSVEMRADEPWTWFYHPPTGYFWLRRAGASLSGIPAEESIATGVAEARQNGRYLDFAIPPTAVETAALAKGDTYTVESMDRNTIRLIPEDDD